MTVQTDQRSEIPESLLSKVRKLLAQAEDPGVTPAEAEAFTAKATELMARYGVERAMLADGDPGSDAITDLEIMLDAPYALDKRDLLAQIAHPCRCRVIHRDRWDGGQKKVVAVLFGFTSDLQRIEVLFTSLLVQAAHGLAVERVPRGHNVAAYRRAWLAGFAMAVGRRLAEAERRAQVDAEVSQPASGRSVALVLADRTKLVAREFDERFSHLRTARPRALSGAGGDAGYAAGERADLGGPKVGSFGRRALKGGR